MLVLRNATYIDWRNLNFKQGNILVNKGEGEGIQFIENDELYRTTAKIIDCTGKFVTKSFVNAHHQSYKAFSTGMPGLNSISGNMYEDLRNIWWKYDKSFDLATIRNAAISTAIACAKNGVTMIIDHHSSPNLIDNSLEIIKQAYDEVGVGNLLCYEISDRDGVDIAKKALIETEKYLEKNEGLVGLHASFTLTNKTLERAAKIAYKFNSGININVAEDIYDQDNCYDIHNKRVVEQLYDIGILDLKKTILNHCLYLTNNERNLIHESNVNVVQNTEINICNSSGNFSSCGLGNNIMLGTCGMHSNMLRAAKATFFNGQTSDSLNFKKIYLRFRQVHNYFSNNGLRGDGENNLVVFDYQPHTDFNKDNFYGHFLFGFDASSIKHVIAKGELVVENRVITKVDEAEIKHNSRMLSKKLWGKMHEMVFD